MKSILIARIAQKLPLLRRVRLIAVALIFSPLGAWADVNYDDPNLAFNSGESSEGAVCVTDGPGANLDDCLREQGMVDLAQAGGAVSLSRHLIRSRRAQEFKEETRDEVSRVPAGTNAPRRKKLPVQTR